MLQVSAYGVVGREMESTFLPISSGDNGVYNANGCVLAHILETFVIFVCLCYLLPKSLSALGASFCLCNKG